MKIVLYTIDNPGFINRYYMHRLLSESEHDFLVVSVRQQSSVFRNLTKKLIRFIYELRFGKQEIRNENNKLRRIFDKETPKRKSEINMVRVSAVNDAESESVIKTYAPELIIQLGAGILKENIFGIPALGTINVHHGFAPEIRGQQSTLWALYYGLTDRIGVTCHYIDAGLDTGAVIEQYLYTHQKGDNYLKIQEKLVREGYNCLIASMNKISSGSKPQFNETAVLSCYFSYFKPELYDKLKKNLFEKIEDLDTYSKKKTRAKKIAVFPR